jgi:hypothetical protein
MVILKNIFYFKKIIFNINPLKQFKIQKIQNLTKSLFGTQYY